MSTITISRPALRTGRVLSGLSILLLALDSLAKLVKAAPVLAGTAQLGYPVSLVVPIGVILAVCVAAYAIPATSALGAVLLTGYLGGAVATHLRLQNPLFTHTLFPIYIAALVWGGLVLREPRLRALLTGRSRREVQP